MQKSVFSVSMTRPGETVQIKWNQNLRQMSWKEFLDFLAPFCDQPMAIENRMANCSACTESGCFHNQPSSHHFFVFAGGDADPKRLLTEDGRSISVEGLSLGETPRIHHHHINLPFVTFGYRPQSAIVFHCGPEAVDVLFTKSYFQASLRDIKLALSAELALLFGENNIRQMSKLWAYIESQRPILRDRIQAIETGLARLQQDIELSSAEIRRLRGIYGVFGSIPFSEGSGK